MRIGTWLALTGVSGLLGACDGQTILGNAAAGAAGVAGQAVAMEPAGGDTTTEDPSGGTGGEAGAVEARRQGRRERGRLSAGGAAIPAG